MQNLVLTPIDPDSLVNKIATEVTARMSQILRDEYAPKKNDADELLTVQGAADFLKLTKQTIYTKVSNNELPVMKQGNRLYFSKKDLMNYLREGKKLSNDEVEAIADAYLNRKKGK